MIIDSDSLLIKQFTCSIVDANSFLVVEGNKGLLIDATDSDELYKAIEPLSELTIILTHCHFDHIVGLNRIRELKPQTKVVATSLCSEYIGNSYKNMSSVANIFLMFYNKQEIEEDLIKPTICKPAEMVFDDKLDFDWNGHNINLLAVQGHSNDSLIAIMDNKYLFSGDSLLSIPTVTRFPNGSTRKFWEEDIPLLKSLNQELVVYPGHGMPGSMIDMLSVNKLPKKYNK